MYKKLAGIFTLMIMLTIFILPMQAKACDHPSCLRAKEVMAEAAEVSIDDILDFCAYRPSPTVAREETGLAGLDDVTRSIVEDLLQYLTLKYGYGTTVEFVSIDFNAFRPTVAREETGLAGLDDVTHSIVEDLLQYLTLKYGYDTTVEFVSIDIVEAVQQYGHIQPRLGCCLNQDIRIGHSIARVFQIDPSNRNWEFCARYEVWRTVWCTSCRFACTDSRRMVNVIPGCRMLRVRFTGFEGENIIDEESYKEECDNCL